MNTDTTDRSSQASPQNDSVSDLADSMSNAKLENEAPDNASDKKPELPRRPLMIYPRPGILGLSKSPMVKVPEGMPPLKEWFGSEHDQASHKKDGESSSPPHNRERRFRRDPEDGDVPSRPTFRGTLTQPSQMGNFKHQSIRSTDRSDRDKDGDKERERDIRDKEGQERLRHLSDKYDRDRLALPPTSINARNKERDAAPHLNAGSSRTSGRDGAAALSRRTEPREGGGKKKFEPTEDWRRAGGDSGRNSRDDRSEGSRRDRDRDDRDRPRSRVRDVSGPRRERSSSRRDRDDKDRDRDRRPERERDDYRRDGKDDFRREKDDYLRRDRDLDKDIEPDDPRRWRDDGKRDERVAARREREYRDRVRDKPTREDPWDASGERNGGRWTVVEDRDSRSKRSSGRDRRALDEGKEKEDRRDRDRDRDREREKEPAWMDTYIPSGPDAAILGGKGSDGELDGIQAFKKGMKAKELKDHPSLNEPLEPNSQDTPSAPPNATSVEKALDEIQLFKLMMKKEQEHNVPEKPPSSSVKATPMGPTLQEIESNLPTTTGKHLRKATPSNDPRSSENEIQGIIKKIPHTDRTSSPSISIHLPDTPQTLLSILSSASTAIPLTSSVPSTPSLDPSLLKPSGSRFFPKPLASETFTSSSQEHSPSHSQAPPQFNPPPGSRLLAFGARNNPAPSTSQPPAHSSLASFQQQSNEHRPSEYQNTSNPMSHLSELNQRPAMAEAIRAQQGYSPFELQSRSNFSASELGGNYGPNVDQLRRTSMVSPADRTTFSGMIDSGPPYSNMNSNHASANSDNFSVNGSGQPFDPINHGSQKGSRFAKYFEEKGRDSQPTNIRKPPGPVGYQSSSPISSQRSDQGGYNSLPSGPASRTVDDLFAMLNTSNQGSRGNPVSHLGMNGGQYGQGNMQSVQQQQHVQQQLLHQQQISMNRNLDSLYESRLDDRNFVPDGMVPGLRQAPPPRNRDSNNSMYADPLDDPMQFNSHRLPPQQRGLDPNSFSNTGPLMYNQQGRNAGLPLHQPQFRGNPSPNSLQGPLQQRIPPGLTNLGGRPPHEPVQFLGANIGMQQQQPGLHAPIHGNGLSPQPYNNFSVGGSGLGGNVTGGPGGFGGNMQMRGPPGGHLMPNSLGPNPMGHLGGGMDLRGGPSNQGQLLGLGVGPNNGGGLRGLNGFGPPQGPPVQTPLQMAMRQQQQHLPPHMMVHQGHHLPPHMQQQGLPGANTQDLMALLMGGVHRE